MVQFFPLGAIFQMAHQIHRTQVAHSSLGVRCVERDFGTQIRRVDHAGMLLRRAHIASVFEGDPGMTGFKQHREHLAPQIGGLDGARRLDLTTRCLGFVGHIGCFKIQAKLVVQIGHIGWGKQRPAAFFHDPAHEQIGDPVGGVHVMGAAAVIAGVFAQLQKLLNVEMPGFQVGADRAFALTALIDRHGCVVHHFEEGNNPLRLTVGALDARAQGAHAGPVVAQSAGELGQQGVFLDGLVNPVQIIWHRGQVARRQLRTQGTTVEQGGRGRHEVKRGQNFIELDGPGFAVNLVERQTHGNAHEESLGQLNALFVSVQKVTVIQRL